MKANALHSNRAHFQRREELGTSQAKAGGSAIRIVATAAAFGRNKLKGTAKQQEVEKDQALVLYEFVALLVRLAFARENPAFGQPPPAAAPPARPRRRRRVASSDWRRASRTAPRAGCAVAASRGRTWATASGCTR